MDSVPGGQAAASSADGDERERPTDGDEVGGAAGRDGDDDVRAHLADVEDGCGCAEMWEHLSSGREE